MKVEFNTARIKVTVAQDLRGRMELAAKQRAEEIVEDGARGMVEDVLQHPVTKEIEAGIGSASTSGTLDGGEVYPPKSLSGFIGFRAGDEPIADIIQRMDPNDPDGPKVELVSQRRGQYSFRVTIGQMVGAIYAATPMPWARGLSWAKKIESGIAGFSHYLAVSNRKNSQSGGGIQVKPEVRPYDYTPPKEGYLTPIFARFIERLRIYGKGGFKRRFKG